MQHRRLLLRHQYSPLKFLLRFRNETRQFLLFPNPPLPICRLVTRVRRPHLEAQTATPLIAGVELRQYVTISLTILLC